MSLSTSLKACGPDAGYGEPRPQRVGLVDPTGEASSPDETVPSRADRYEHELAEVADPNPANPNPEDEELVGFSDR